MIKAILFDFAGVIVTEGYWLWLNEIVPDLPTKKEFFQHLSELGDAGKINQEEYLLRLSEATGVKTDEIYPQIVKKIQINSKLLSLISKLRKNYRIGLITNYTHGLFDKLSSIYELPKYFDRILVSSRVGMIKPDPNFYQMMFDAQNVQAEECLYIDDRNHQVKAAVELGMKSVLFTNMSFLIAAFRKLGIRF